MDKIGEIGEGGGIGKILKMIMDGLMGQGGDKKADKAQQGGGGASPFGEDKCSIGGG
jgi:hypothetical protein